MLKETKNWIDSSDYKTAEYMLQTGRYIYVIFTCHISIEKILKALIQESPGKLPPKTHDLIYLSKLANVQLSENLLEFIGKINSAGILTRYPEDLSAMIASYPESVAKEYFDKTKEVLDWLKQDKRLK
jgi:HEPN domain-containing protein